MSLTLRIVTIVICLAFLFFVVRLVTKNRLQLKYSLMWMGLAILLLICAIFPQIVTFFSNLFGFEQPSNFIFMMGLFCLMAIALSLSIIVSWQSRYIRSLVQTVALLQAQVDDKEETPDQEK